MINEGTSNKITTATNIAQIRKEIGKSGKADAKKNNRKLPESS